MPLPPAVPVEWMQDAGVDPKRCTNMPSSPKRANERGRPRRPAPAARTPASRLWSQTRTSAEPKPAGRAGGAFGRGPAKLKESLAKPRPQTPAPSMARQRHRRDDSADHANGRRGSRVIWRRTANPNRTY